MRGSTARRSLEATMLEPGSAARRPHAAIAREAVVVGCAILVYFAVRNVTAGSAAAAFANADRLVGLEDALGLGVEERLQEAIVDSRWATALANWVYIWGHWPVLVGVGVALYVRCRERYYLLRNALIVSGAIGFLFFALFPVAPPRLLDGAFVDTVTESSHAYRALQPPGLTNQFAAFPSLHAGWNLVVGIVVFGATSRLVLRALALASPTAMFLAVVATANHYVLDVAGGVVVVLAGLAVAAWMGRRAAPTLDDRERLDLPAGPERAHRPRPVRGRPPRREPARAAAGRAREPARRG
jgi:hypothetical protein